MLSFRYYLLCAVATLVMGAVTVSAQTPNKPDKTDKAKPKIAEEKTDKKTKTPDRTSSEVKEAFTEKSEDLGGKHAKGIKRFFDKYTKAIEKKDVAAVQQLFDAKGMIDLVEEQKLLPDTLKPRKEKLTDFLDTVLSRKLLDPVTGMLWERYEIRRVTFLKPGREATVYTRQWDADNVSIKLRWWLRNRSGQWEFYDLEILEFSMRFSALMGVGFKMADQNDPSVKQVPKFMEAVQLAQTGDGEKATKILTDMADVGLPPVLESLRLMVIAAYHSDEGNHKKAIEATDAAGKVNHDLPMIHLIYGDSHNGLGNHKKALKYSDKYADLLGKDAAYYAVRGDAYRGLKNNDQAKAAYEAGIKDDPTDGNNVLGLIRITDVKDTKKLLKAYEALNPLADWFAQMAKDLAVDGDISGLEVLVKLHEEAMPKDKNLKVVKDELMKLKTDKTEKTDKSSKTDDEPEKSKKPETAPKTPDLR